MRPTAGSSLCLLSVEPGWMQWGETSCGGFEPHFPHLFSWLSEVSLSELYPLSNLTFPCPQLFLLREEQGLCSLLLVLLVGTQGCL